MQLNLAVPVPNLAVPVRSLRSVVPWVHRRRRVWRTNGRAHIEVRGIHRVENGAMAEALERELRAVESLDWVHINAVLGAAVVAFDESSVNFDDVMDAVDRVEDAFEVGSDDTLDDAAPHPASTDPLRYGVFDLGADVAGMAVGIGARFMRLPRIPIEIAVALPALDSLPPIRRAIEARPAIEVTVASVGALLQGLAQGPIGLAVDATQRALTLREVKARRELWEQHEAELHAPGESGHVEAFDRPPRPMPVPDGLLERYASVVPLGSTGIAGVAFAATRDPRKAADVLLAGNPRAVRLGRDSFCAHLSWILARRGVLALDTRVLRHLDRIDTVVVDDDVLDLPAEATETLFAAIREAAQDLVLASDADGRPRLDVPADAIVSGGTELASSVRALQAEGRVVAVVSRTGGEALATADIGIGITALTSGAPWGAHLFCPTLYDAAVVIDATAAARTAGRRIATVAAGGSSAAAILALTPAPAAGRRVVLAGSVAALGAMAAGVWTAAPLDGVRIAPDEPVARPWHALAPDEVLDAFHSTGRGLDASEAHARRRAEPEHSAPNLASLLRSELANPLTAVLAAGGVLSTVAGSVVDGVLIGGVLGMNALVGATQRWQTERAINGLNAELSRGLARVRRNDTVITVGPDELVEGDLLVLQAGDVVSADARITTSVSVEADESSLTGESLPIAKTVAGVALDAAVADRTSMVFAGTSIAAGQAEAIVVAAGERSEARRALRTRERPPVTGVEARLADLTRKSVPITLGAGGLLAGATLLRGAPVREAVTTGVSLAAAAVPEGLPFLATVAQAAAGRRLSERDVLVRNTSVLEALGRVDVLCFDKTGTLTEGKLRLRSVSDGETVQAMPHVAGDHRMVLAAAGRATPRRRGHALPHPTDQAVVDAIEAADLSLQEGVSSWKKSASLPFSSTRPYHAVMGRDANGRMLSVKGAPEVIVPRCERWRIGDRIIELEESTRQRLHQHVEELAGSGLRVLAVAERSASGGEDLDDPSVARLELRGFVTVADVTRASAAQPIADLQRAGIAVVMLTGDHPQTAEAIGRELGLVNGGVVTGPELDALDDAQLDATLRHATVFARVTPAHKVRIVKGYQRNGRVVAMTGDGANDAAAIRLADIGIAFGQGATAAARGAADLVIADDHLETLIAAMVEGRTMWASVRDAVAMLLGGNLGEVLFTTGATVVTGRSPLNARQLLAVNMLTDLVPAMALALRRPAARSVDLRNEGPENSLGGRLNRDIAVRAAATAGATTSAWTVARFTGTRTRADTVAFAALVGTQLGQTVVAGLRSPLVLASTALSTGALVTIVQTPGLSQFFGCRPLGPVGWSIATASALVGTATSMLACNLLGPNDRDPAEPAVPTHLDLTADDAGLPPHVHSADS